MQEIVSSNTTPEDLQKYAIWTLEDKNAGTKFSTLLGGSFGMFVLLHDFRAEMTHDVDYQRGFPWSIGTQMASKRDCVLCLRSISDVRC